MNKNLSHSLTIRKKIIEQTAHLSIEQLNAIPQGMNNNIAWHIGHLSVSTEMLCYIRSGVQAERVVALADHYNNGTKPEAFISSGEVTERKERMLTCIQMIQEDYDQGVFALMQPYATFTFGVTMNAIEEVFEFCTFHDALHWGMIMTMRKLV